MICFEDDEYRGTVRDFVQAFNTLQPSSSDTPEHVLGTIRVDLQRCTAEDMQQLWTIFQSTMATKRRVLETIEKIIFVGEDIDGFTLRQLGPMLENLPLKTSQVVLFCNSTQSTTPQLLTSLSTNSSHLKEVQLSRLVVAAEGARVLANDLISGNHLEVLQLDACRLGNEGCSLLLRAALNGETSKVRQLHMTQNQITALDVEAIELLKTNTRLQTLDLSDNSIGDAGATLLAEALAVNQSLTTLYLAECAIDNAGCSALCMALQVNQVLMELDLDCNFFGDDSADILAFSLRHNRHLECLAIRNSNLTTRGAQALVEVAQTYLHCCSVTLFDETYDDETLKQHQTLVHSAQEFQCGFGESCRRLLLRDESSTADATILPDVHQEEEMGQLLPLLGSTHALVKPTVLFLLARRRPDDAARAWAETTTTTITTGNAEVDENNNVVSAPSAADFGGADSGRPIAGVEEEAHPINSATVAHDDDDATTGLGREENNQQHQQSTSEKKRKRNHENSTT